MRFPKQFGRSESLGKMLCRIREADGGEPLGCLRPFLQELDDINDYSKHFHHGENPAGADSYPIEDTELKAYVERTLKVISGFLEAGATA